MVEKDQLIQKIIKDKDFLIYNIKPKKYCKREIKDKVLVKEWKRMAEGMKKRLKKRKL